MTTIVDNPFNHGEPLLYMSSRGSAIWRLGPYRQRVKGGTIYFEVLYKGQWWSVNTEPYSYYVAGIQNGTYTVSDEQ